MSSMSASRGGDVGDFVGRNIELVEHDDSRRKRELEPPEMVLNLTPMIDVIFQLLIYFVVTASFAVGEGVIVAKMPEGSGVEPSPLDPPKTRLIVQVNSVGADPTGYMITVQGRPERPTNFRELAEVLRQMRGVAAKEDDPVVIQPDGQVRWQHAVNAFNAAIAARYTDVRFGQSASD